MQSSTPSAWERLSRSLGHCQGGGPGGEKLGERLENALEPALENFFSDEAEGENAKEFWKRRIAKLAWRGATQERDSGL